MPKKILFLDVECYPNYFLILFKNKEGMEECFILDSRNTLPKSRIINLLTSYQTIGFNSRMYDIPMIISALRGSNNLKLKSLSDRIINNEEKTFNILCSENLWTPYNYDHIDLMNVAIGRVGLKMYGARLGSKILQDLPYEPNKLLSEKEKSHVKKYCSNDIDLTIDLYKHLYGQLKLRENINEIYDVDVRSKSDAQIAEVLINKELIKTNKIEQEYGFIYTPPDYLYTHNSSILNNLIENYTNNTFKGKKGDKLLLGTENNKITIGNTTYTYGIGGLHSTEEKRTIKVKEDEYLIDIDVVSYYPTIILNNKYSPNNFDKDDFLSFYKDIYNSRIDAKIKGDKIKSDVYKIILNGSFGKFNDQYSSLYSPQLLINTTITGQLTLIMLIELLENEGFSVVSSNTDGIVVLLKKNLYNKFKNIVENWQDKVNMQVEETFYKSLHSQSVNSYIAIKQDNSVKLKGIFAYGDLSRNPAIEICKEAIINYLIKGCKIEDTILNCKNNNKFLMVRKVKDGGYWRGKYLGKVVRWYWGNNGEPITNYKGDKVAFSDNAIPMMNLDNTIFDINYNLYVDKTYKFLKDLGVDDVRK